ncbi:MAG: ABC transporter substrate-binding protein, partial [Chloroflexi bacterium]|nr:ABC transporter substrate-binding protein [Chloroflexota bacterium]
MDKRELPFKDIRVRQALMMATDFQAIKNELYEGDADLLAWPVINQPETKGAYRPLETLPPAVAALWKYNPEKAKQLLAEAGYPNGFKTKVV